MGDEQDDEIARVTDEIAARLRARGIAVHDGDSPDDVVRLLESLEAFESAVETHGGDLMIDEPPSGNSDEPDDPHFLLPTRSADESATSYLERLAVATASIRKHRKHP
jgi:hypothetical protein